MTRWPIRAIFSLAPAPIAATTPHGSCPAITGSGLTGNPPIDSPPVFGRRYWCRSLPHIPEAFISTTTSPGPGIGSGNSIISSCRSPGKTTPRMGSSDFLKQYESSLRPFALTGYCIGPKTLSINLWKRRGSRRCRGFRGVRRTGHFTGSASTLELDIGRDILGLDAVYSELGVEPFPDLLDPAIVIDPSVENVTPARVRFHAYTHAGRQQHARLVEHLELAECRIFLDRGQPQIDCEY